METKKLKTNAYYELDEERSDRFVLVMPNEYFKNVNNADILFMRYSEQGDYTEGPFFTSKEELAKKVRMRVKIRDKTMQE